MLRQRLNAVQWLVRPGSFPVPQDLILTQLGPLPNELQRPRLETPGKISPSIDTEARRPA
jgi:hypothetical protein